MKEVFKKISKNTWSIILFSGLALLFLIFDLVSKQVVLHSMKEGEIIGIIPNFFYFQYIVNDGMAFGLNLNVLGAVANQIIFISVSLIGMAIILFAFIKSYKKTNKLVIASLGLMLAGCVGNLIDRIFYSQKYLASFDANVSTRGVVDFIAFDFGSYQFPRFNIADSSLVIGVIILVVCLIIDEVKDAKIRRKREEEKMPEGKILSKDEMVLENKTEEVKEDTSEMEEKKIESEE